MNNFSVFLIFPQKSSTKLKKSEKLVSAFVNLKAYVVLIPQYLFKFDNASDLNILQLQTHNTPGDKSYSMHHS